MSSNLALIISCVASLIVFVKSRQICSTSKECEKGCCYQSSCTTNEILCELLKEKSKYERSCYRNQDCLDGCCINHKCQKTPWSLECTDKNACTKNSDCFSDCCKNGKCQNVPCFTLPTTTPINFDDIWNKCTTSNDCFQPSKSCCVSGRCRACHQDSRNDYNDYNHYSRSSSSSSSGAGTGVSIAIGVVIVIFVIIFKIAFCYYRINRRRVVVVRRRCVQTSVVPIVENDELQREHERIEHETQRPDCSPPPYSPTTGETGNQNTGQNQGQIEGETNTSESYGVPQGSPIVPQGSPMVPPPAYYPNHAAYRSENTTQPDQIQFGRMTDDIEEMNGVPQGSTMAPPPTYPPNPKRIPQANQTQREVATSNTEIGVPQGMTVEPFLI